ncbi:hypothetical protein ABK040_014194 [Willaertia magna]
MQENLFSQSKTRESIQQRILSEIFNVNKLNNKRFNIDNKTPFYQLFENELRESVETLFRNSLKIYLNQQQKKNQEYNFNYFNKIINILQDFLNHKEFYINNNELKIKLLLIPIYFISEYCYYFQQALPIEKLFDFLLQNEFILKTLKICCESTVVCLLELLKTIKMLFDTRKVNKLEHLIYNNNLTTMNNSEGGVCGKILLFTAYVLPFHHDSVINKIGHVNTSHLDLNKDSNTLNNTFVDIKDNNFEIFWNIQDKLIEFISMKNSLRDLYNLQNIGDWKEFVNGMEKILKCFEMKFIQHEQLMKQLSFNKQQQSLSTNNNTLPTGTTSNNDKNITNTEDSNNKNVVEKEEWKFIFPKLLKNRKLFELQLDDISFKRQVTIQYLIIILRLIELHSNKSDFILNDLKNLKDKLIQYLQKRDEQFFQMIEILILKRERNWCDWKFKNNCQAFHKLQLEDNLKSTKRAFPNMGVEFKNILNDNLYKSDEIERFLKLDNDELENTFKTYNLNDRLNIIKEELNYEDEQDKLVNKSKVYIWKTNRLILEEDLNLLKRQSNYYLNKNNNEEGEQINKEEGEKRKKDEHWLEELTRERLGIPYESKENDINEEGDEESKKRKLDEYLEEEEENNERKNKEEEEQKKVKLMDKVIQEEEIV